jgi:hypothetical protein
MRLITSVLVGVATACLIFAVAIVVPQTVIRYYSGGYVDEWLDSPLNVEVVISNLTEPVGVNSEADVTIIVTSTKNASNTTVTMEVVSPSIPPQWPLGITVIEGNFSAWVGDLTANVSVVFHARIRAVEAGYARIWITATYPDPAVSSLSHRGEDSVWILVQENDIQVSYGPITPPDQPPFLPELPIPSNLTLNVTMKPQ